MRVFPLTLIVAPPGFVFSSASPVVTISPFKKSILYPEAKATNRKVPITIKIVPIVTVREDRVFCDIIVFVAELIIEQNLS